MSKASLDDSLTVLISHSDQRILIEINFNLVQIILPGGKRRRIELF